MAQNWLRFLNLRVFISDFSWWKIYDLDENIIHSCEIFIENIEESFHSKRRTLDSNIFVKLSNKSYIKKEYSEKKKLEHFCIYL